MLTFPPVDNANQDGLLCVGGALNSATAFAAHSRGIFPWPIDNFPMLWWAPNPRAIIPTDGVHVSRSMRKRLRHEDYRITLDSAFSEVIHLCAKVHGETWINAAIIDTYTTLFHEGRAHSCELWIGDNLCGGLYGVCLNRVFCGESMFSLEPNASKIVLIALCGYLQRHGVTTLDTQFTTPHLIAMGAQEISRADYQSRLDNNPDRLRGKWQWDYVSLNN